MRSRPHISAELMLHQMGIQYDKNNIAADYVLFLATLRRWDKIRELIQQKRLPESQLNSTWQTGPFQGANALWFLAHEQQWFIITALMKNNLITPEQLLAECDDRCALSFFSEKKATFCEQVKDTILISISNCLERLLRNNQFPRIESLLGIMPELPFILIQRAMHHLLQHSLRSESFERRLNTVLTHTINCKEQTASVDVKRNYIRSFFFEEIKNSRSISALRAIEREAESNVQLHSLFITTSYGLFSDASAWEKLKTDVRGALANQSEQLREIAQRKQAS